MGVIIIREMVGISPRSWSDAARQAGATAAKTGRHNHRTEDRLRIRGLSPVASQLIAG
jgi:hypothetical protein